MSTAVRSVTRFARPTIRVRPAPPLDPPFDDEIAAEVWLRASPEQLAFDFGPPAPVPRPVVVPIAPFAPFAPAVGSPEGRRAAHRFAALCLEVLNGFRPAAHLRPLSRPSDAGRVVERLIEAIGRLPRHHHRPGRPTDLVKLRLLRVCEPVPGVIEAAASLGTTGRTWAMAFRLERRRDRWLGTTLEVI
jgi:hypothetical protein